MFHSNVSNVSSDWFVGLQVSLVWLSRLAAVHLRLGFTGESIALIYRLESALRISRLHLSHPKHAGRTRTQAFNGNLCTSACSLQISGSSQAGEPP